MGPPVVLRPRAGSVAASAASGTGLSGAASLGPSPSANVLIPPQAAVAAQPSLVHSDSDSDSDSGRSETTALNPIQPASTISYGGSTTTTGNIPTPPSYRSSAAPPAASANPEPLSGTLLGDPVDVAKDAQNVRPGEISASWNEQGWEKVTSPDMTRFLGELFDLTHAIDAGENEIDQIVALRNRIVKLKPHLDVSDLSQPDVEPDLHSLAALTSKLGRDILNLESWLVGLDAQNRSIRSRVKNGDDTVDVTLDEMRDIKFNLSSAKLDFADAMERIREGAWKERERRERNRIWLAQYIRAREPRISDQDVESLLKASELGAADGIEENDPTSYAGLWALRNPFTEIAELTHGMAFVRDSFPLDHTIVKAIVPAPEHDKFRRHTAEPSRIAWLTQTRWAPRPAPPLPGSSGREKETLAYAEEKDMEFGYARQKQRERAASRKRMIIALLVVLVLALIVLVLVSTLDVQDELLTGSGSW